MSWVKIDDAMPEHPKVQAAGPLAFALDIAGLAYSNRHSTAGFLPMAKVRTLLDWSGVEARYLKPVDQDAGPRMSVALAEILRAVGRWHRVGEDECGCIPADADDAEGYWIHDYSGYQESPERAAEIRRMRSEAGKKGAARRWQTPSKRDGTRVAPHQQLATSTDSNGVAKSCPVPVPVPEEKEGETRARAREAPPPEHGSLEHDTAPTLREARPDLVPLLEATRRARPSVPELDLPYYALYQRARKSWPNAIEMREALDNVRSASGLSEVVLVASFERYFDREQNPDKPQFVTPKRWAENLAEWLPKSEGSHTPTRADELRARFKARVAAAQGGAPA